MLDGTVRASPRRDGRETVGSGRRNEGPILEDDRLASGDPFDAATRKVALGRADVLADREVHVVVGDARVAHPRGMPELGEPGIDIDVRLPAEPAEQGGRPEVPADVHQEVGGARELSELGERRAERASIAREQCRDEAVSPGDFPEELEVGRLLDVARRARGVDATRDVDLFEQMDVGAEPSQAVGPTDTDPGLAAVAGHVRERAGYDDRRHAGFTASTKKVSRSRLSSSVIPSCSLPVWR